MFHFVFYVDQLKSSWIENLSTYSNEFYVSPIHFENIESTRPHYHLAISCDSREASIIKRHFNALCLEHISDLRELRYFFNDKSIDPSFFMIHCWRSGDHFYTQSIYRAEVV